MYIYHQKEKKLKENTFPRLDNTENRSRGNTIFGSEDRKEREDTEKVQICPPGPKKCLLNKRQSPKSCIAVSPFIPRFTPSFSSRPPSPL